MMTVPIQMTITAAMKHSNSTKFSSTGHVDVGTVATEQFIISFRFSELASLT
jgi:hypothetical protein